MEPGTEGLSSETRLDGLSVTGRGILMAARVVLRNHGLEGLTVEAVANEANVSRSSIPYHFGSRAGLIAVLIASLFHDYDADTWKTRKLSTRPAGAEVSAPGDTEREQSLAGSSDGAGDLHRYLEVIRTEAHDVVGQRDFFELVVLALRDATLQARLAMLYREYRELDLLLTGVPSESGSDSQHSPVGAVLQAIADGLGLQKVIDPDFDLDAAVEAARDLLRLPSGKATAQS